MKKVRDHYSEKARREGYAARSAYKLEEIDRRHRLIRPGMRVLELGCAPGSWLQYTAGKVGTQGQVLGVDLQPLAISLPPNARALTGDVFDLAPQALLGGGPPFDLLLSDMAPRTTGIKATDAARSAELARRVLELAGTLLWPGGACLAKLFQGAESGQVRKEFSALFGKVTLEKPRASRGESVEVFLLGLDRRG